MQSLGGVMTVFGRLHHLATYFSWRPFLTCWIVRGGIVLRHFVVIHDGLWGWFRGRVVAGSCGGS